MTIHDPARSLVGGSPRAVIVPARVARQLSRLLHQHHEELRRVWSYSDLEAGAVLAALDQAGYEWARKETVSPSGTSDFPGVDDPSDLLRDELDTATVAQRLRCTARNVRHLHARGRLAGRIVGGRLFFNPEDVATFIERKELT